MQALLDAIARMPLPTDACRVFHGRGGRYPGCEHLTLDAFPPVWLVTSFLPLEEAELARLHDALSARWAQLNPGEPLNWVFQYRHEARAETRLMAGSVPEPHLVSENGAAFRVHLLRGLNHGFFLDMAEAAAAWASWRPPARASSCSTCSPTPVRSRWWPCWRGPAR